MIDDLYNNKQCVSKKKITNNFQNYAKLVFQTNNDNQKVVDHLNCISGDIS